MWDILRFSENNGWINPIDPYDGKKMQVDLKVN